MTNNYVDRTPPNVGTVGKPNFVSLVQLLEFIGSALSLDNQHEYDANPDSVETFSVLMHHHHSKELPD